MEKEYQIRISGSGTRSEIVRALNVIIGNLMHKSKPDEDIEVTWEDPILLTDINPIES